MQEFTAVNRTAMGVAATRDRESRRPDRLFDDPYAELLTAGSSAPTVPSATTAAAADQRGRLRAHVLLRTRFYDDWLRQVGLDQVVVLGAGLDARAWRLSWPAATVLYEIDEPPVLAYKAERLVTEPRCDRRAVAADLREDWPQALTSAGFEPTRPTAWLVEGLLVYLENAVAHAVLAAATALSAPGSALSCEPSGTVRRLPGTVSSLWRDGLPEGAGVALSELGSAATAADGDALAASWGRPELAITGSHFVVATL